MLLLAPGRPTVLFTLGRSVFMPGRATLLFIPGRGMLLFMPGRPMLLFTLGRETLLFIPGRTTLLFAPELFIPGRPMLLRATFPVPGCPKLPLPFIAPGRVVLALRPARAPAIPPRLTAGGDIRLTVGCAKLRAGAADPRRAPPSIVCRVGCKPGPCTAANEVRLSWFGETLTEFRDTGIEFTSVFREAAVKPLRERRFA